jgi:Concanavalin A-like lectin/glucanases superfamily
MQMKWMIATAVLSFCGVSFGVQTHYLPFDANANDASGNGNNGTLVGGASITSPGRVGAGALSTNSGSGGVTLAPFQRPAGFTFATWVNIQSISGAEAFLFGQVTDNNSNLQLRVNGGSGVWQMGMYNNTNFSFQAFNTAAGGNGALIPPRNLIGAGWVHLAAVIDDAGLEKLYVDGQLANTGNLTNGVPGTVLYTSLGKLQTGANAFLSQGFVGQLDETRIYNEVLSDAAIAALVPEPASLAGVAMLGKVLVRRRV